MSCVVKDCAKRLGVDERTIFSQAALAKGYQSNIDSLVKDFFAKSRTPSFVTDYCQEMMARDKPRKHTGLNGATSDLEADAIPQA